MTRCYFDTNIYSHLLDNKTDYQQVKQAVDTKIIGIFISLDNLRELIGTDNKQRAQELLQLTRSICFPNRATQFFGNIIKAEFRHLIDSSVALNIYTNEKYYKAKFVEYWKKLAKNPDIDKGEIARELEIDKIDLRNYMRDAKGVRLQRKWQFLRG